jgi:hypothetical protein
MSLKLPEDISNPENLKYNVGIKEFSESLNKMLILIFLILQQFYLQPNHYSDRYEINADTIARYFIIRKSDK